MSLTQVKYFQKSSIGFEFEFYTPMKKIAVRASIKKHLKMPVVLVEDPKSDYSDILMNKRNCVITIDQSGGVDMFELITPPLPYYEAKSLFRKFSNWINEFGTTNNYAGVHINLNITGGNIKKIDKLKFILSFNEDMIYKFFPKRKGNIYCQTIKKIYPNNIYMDLLPEHKYNYWIPDNKYHGVNFTKIEKNYLEYRYIGGENYHKKVDEIFTLMDYFIIHLCMVLEKPKLTVSDRLEFQRIMQPIKKLKSRLYNYDTMKKELPNINLLIDLKNNDTIIKTHWSKISNDIFNILIKNTVRGEVNFNYDTARSAFEIAHCEKVSGSALKGLTFYDCTVSGVLRDCLLIDCVTENASIYNSVVKQSEINNSKIFNTIAENCEFNDVYVSNADTDHTFISGTFNAGVIIKSNTVFEEFFFNEESEETGLIKKVEIIEIPKSLSKEILP